MAEETDPEARAWMKGKHECRNFNPRAFEPEAKCQQESEAKIVALLKAGAEKQEVPSVSAAFKRAAECIEAAPKDEFNVGSYPYTLVKIGKAEHIQACFAEKRVSVARGLQAVEAEYETAQKENSADAWITFIARHREDKRVPDAVKKVVSLAASEQGDAQYAIDERLASTHPESVGELPVERRILLIGPKGLRVRDLNKLKESGVSSTIIVARVKASTEPYKNFDGDELGVLKRLGLADDVVTAMIEVTSKLLEQRKGDDERKALRTELAALRAMIEEKKTAGGGQTVQTSDGPMDVLASCAKRLTAMKACEQIPFPGSTICASTAGSSFPCPKQ